MYRKERALNTNKSQKICKKMKFVQRGSNRKAEDHLISDKFMDMANPRTRT